MKKEREKSTTSKGKAVALFFKKNVYIILMIVCILAIASMITVAAVMNSNKKADAPIANLPGNEKPVEKPEDPNKPVGGGDKPVIKPFEFLLTAPVASNKYGHMFIQDDMVYYSNIKTLGTHNGIDMVAAAGTKVGAGLEGTVVNVTTDDIYMTTVTIEHKEGYTTVYRLLENVTVKIGDKVATGGKIGVVSGNVDSFEGDSETHLHLEVMKNGNFLNPQDYMLEGDK